MIDILLTAIFWIGFSSFISAGVISLIAGLLYAFRTGDFLGLIIMGGLQNWKNFTNEEKMYYKKALQLMLIAMVCLSVSTYFGSNNYEGSEELVALRASISTIFL